MTHSARSPSNAGRGEGEVGAVDAAAIRDEHGVERGQPASRAAAFWSRPRRIVQGAGECSLVPAFFLRVVVFVLVVVVDVVLVVVVTVLLVVLVVVVVFVVGELELDGRRGW